MPRHRLRAALTVLGVAAVTASLVLSVAWPRTTLADGDDPTRSVSPNRIRFGGMVVQGALARADQTVPTAGGAAAGAARDAWIVKVHVENTGTARQSLALQTDVRRTVNNPGNRAEPTPETLWRAVTPVTLGPGEGADLVLAVPEKVGARLSYIDAHPLGRWVAYPMGDGKSGARITTSADVSFWKG